MDYTKIKLNPCTCNDVDSLGIVPDVFLVKHDHDLDSNLSCNRRSFEQHRVNESLDSSVHFVVAVLQIDIPDGQ